MSGIFGYIQNNKDNNTSRAIDINSMLIWNHAYGKEKEDTITNALFGLGCCLDNPSNTTLHSSSAPIIKKGNTYAVIDAFLYNREELINACHLKKENSDSTILFTYIRMFGLDSLKNVNGDFSGAIYDSKSKTLTLFRDHMGIRPLFYYTSNNMICFSTDIRGILSLPTVDISLNEKWIYQTVSGFINFNLTSTEFKHIFCVAPATSMEFSFTDDHFSNTCKKYWSLGKKKIHLNSEKEYITKLRDLITDSIKIRLNAVHGSIGAELSGGLDSSIIDIMIHRLERECTYFSWSLDPNDLPLVPNDERLIIQDICNQEDIKCHYGKMNIDLGPSSNIAQNMASVGIDYSDEPLVFRYAFPPYINTLSLCESSQFIYNQGAKIVFTGHGGDEGVSHRSSPYEMFYHHEYYHFFRYLWSTTHNQKFRIIKTFKKFYNLLSNANHVLKQPSHEPFSAPSLLNSDFSNLFHREDMPISYFSYSPKEYIENGGSRNRLDNVALQGAYCGVRYLIPYLDYRVIDYAVSIPRYLYLKGRHNRYIFREAFKDVMPDSLYSLHCKDDISMKNVTSTSTMTSSDIEHARTSLVNRLNKSNWNKYLDFEHIEKWIHDTAEESPNNEYKYFSFCLLNLAKVDNMISKSRAVNHNTNTKEEIE